jgi:hypothetical protein
MSIKRIKDFPEGSGSLTSDDVFVFMDNPSNGGVTKKVSLNTIANAVNGPTVPSAPTMIKGNGSDGWFDFYPPQWDGGSPILGYKLYSQPDPNIFESYAPSVATLTRDVTDLRFTFDVQNSSVPINYKPGQDTFIRSFPTDPVTGFPSESGYLAQFGWFCVTAYNAIGESNKSMPAFAYYM